MTDPVREIEKVIDTYHKNAPAFKYKRGTALLYALRIFEDACRLGGTSEFDIGGDSLDHTFLIREQLNSLRTAINWIYEECEYDFGRALPSPNRDERGIKSSAAVSEVRQNRRVRLAH